MQIYLQIIIYKYKDRANNYPIISASPVSTRIIILSEEHYQSVDQNKEIHIILRLSISYLKTVTLI
jgi:hypothetical protein